MTEGSRAPVKRKLKGSHRYKKRAKISAGIDSDTSAVKMIPLCSQVEEYEEYGYIKASVLGSMPTVYVKTSSHMRVENMVLDQENTQRITLIGPKGTGKTTCLVAIWTLCKAKSQPVVFTSTKAGKYFRRALVKNYTEGLSNAFTDYKEQWEITRDTSPIDYVSYLYNFVKYLCQKVDKKVLLLVDLCKSDSEDDELTMELADLAYLLPSKKLQVIVAFTSATGKFINNDYVYSSIYNVLYGPTVQKVEFHGFNELEATSFLQHSGSQFTFQQVKEYTGYNPSLLTLVVHNSTLHQLVAMVKHTVIRFVSNNLPNHSSLKSIYLERLKTSDYFFKKAVNQDILDDCDLLNYMDSWIAKHHVCYIVEQNPPYIIRLNFPLLPAILHKEIVELSQWQKEIMIEDPTVRGIFLEHNFFKYFENTADLVIYTNGHQQIKSFQSISNTEHHNHCVALTKFTKGVIYQLRFGHPVIDGIGLLPDQNGRHYLVFIQVSLSHYRDHNSKVNDMFKQYSAKLPELLQHENLFRYYQFIAKASYSKFHCNNSLFLYISPKTRQGELDDKDSLKLLKKHSKGKIQVGVAYKDTQLFRYLERSL